MSITVAEKITAAPAGEYAPMAPAAVRDALRDTPAALVLWLEAQAKPAGWSLGNRDRIAADMGWTKYRVRKAIADLRAAGLYLVERVQDAAGRWSTACRILAKAVFPQVAPEAGLPEVGDSACIPPFREIRERRPGPHLPATCWREAAGLPCRDCAAAARTAPKWPAAAPSGPAYRPAGAVLDRVTPAPPGVRAAAMGALRAVLPQRPGHRPV